MLMLTRTKGEKICVGDNMIITVASIERGKVRIGIEGPLAISVVRAELLNDEEYEAIKEKARGSK